MTATMVRSGKAMCMKRTTGEKLHLMEIMERANEQRAARMKPAKVDCWWYKDSPFGAAWFVQVQDCEELHKRGCTHNKGGGWSLEGAIRDLNKCLEPFNLSVGAVEERPW